MHIISHYLLVLWIVITHPFRKNYTANICGHHTKQIGKGASCGESHVMSMPLSENGNPDYCLDCIAKMSIKCAWCENSIHIGDPVTLYIPEESFKIPEHAVRYNNRRLCLVGCLNRGCADTGADLQGFWMPPGIVARVPSPAEILMSGGNQGKLVIVGNLADPNNLGKAI